MGDGERHKNLRAAERALAFFAACKLERSDAVVALGGGVVGDLAGFAAAVYLRGIAFLQAPTTLLAQIDASVGGKTAVNTREGKNLIGAFHQPRAVVISTDVLQTLPGRELTAGFCEAIKQGAIGSSCLFAQTRRFLVAAKMNKNAREFERTPARADDLAALIAAQVAFKAKIVTADEREDVGRTDARSRRILNFGHTAAHALEAVTHYRRFRHGEAVGYGMIVAGEISNRLGMLDSSELESLRACIRLAGRLPRADDLDERAILRAIATDKKSVGGHLRWVLLERIGRARIVGAEEIPPHVVRAALHAALVERV
jgi:3-dehydroquinate synthase